jgi:hypothetical protein
MKKLLVTLLCAASTILSAQITGRMITDHTSTQDMVWSEVEGTYMFFPKVQRYEEYNMIESNINQSNTGKIVITDIKTKVTYTWTVYQVNYDKTEEGTEFVRCECIEVQTGDQCTFIFTKYADHRMVSIMMPSSRLAIFMDDFGDEE